MGKERERLEEERKNPNFQQPIITMAKSQESLEKGQLDNIEQEQSVKVSPRDSPPPPRAPTTQIEQEEARIREQEEQERLKRERGDEADGGNPERADQAAEDPRGTGRRRTEEA